MTAVADSLPGGLAFLPHGTCFLWQPGLLWITVLSDAAVALAYYSIPVALFHVLRKRTDVPFDRVVGLFALFIVLCGTTHVLDIVDIWHPVYWLAAWTNLATAGVSVLTAVVLVRVLPRLLRMPSPVTDMLTGLPNRLLLLDRLGQAVARARRGGSPFAILFVDLDHFKDVNDTLGHGAGDAVLTAVATRLGRTLRTSDTLARFGGDEFVVLLERAISEEYARDVAQRLIDGLAAPFVIAGHSLSIGASIGVVVTDGRAEPLDLIAEADRAMYAAKVARRGSFALAGAAV